MLNINTLPRIFEAKINGEKISLADPGVQMSPDEVVNFYSQTYPELITATISGPSIKEDKAVYKLDTEVGTKG